jgi:hypothetical protein
VREGLRLVRSKWIEAAIAAAIAAEVADGDPPKGAQADGGLRQSLRARAGDISPRLKIEHCLSPGAAST